MSGFLESIKVTKEDKQNAMSKVLYIIINSTNLLSLSDLLKKQPDLISVLSEDELLAIHNLSSEVKRHIVSSNQDNELIEYLDLTSDSLNKDNLSIFINQAVKDMQAQRKRNPNLKWHLQTKKIFDRLEGKNPYEEELAKREENKSGKIIKFGEQK